MGQVRANGIGVHWGSQGETSHPELTVAFPSHRSQMSTVPLNAMLESLPPTLR